MPTWYLLVEQPHALSIPRARALRSQGGIHAGDELLGHRLPATPTPYASEQRLAVALDSRSARRNTRDVRRAPEAATAAVSVSTAVLWLEAGRPLKRGDRLDVIAVLCQYANMPC